MSKRLPPLNALRVFDAAARHLSFTRAAEELFVTQAAVSHQIKSLEDFLGLKLFRRRNRSLLLTEEGQSYFLDIKEIFSQLTEATRKLQARSAKGALTVSLLPSFAIHWLVPRLSSFNSAYPGIDVRIQAVDRQEDKLADDVDFHTIARMASGASGAELANIINEGALRAVRAQRNLVTQSDLEESVEVVIAGYQKKNAILSDKEKHTVAYHEIGHALVAALQTNSAPVQKITIIPRTSGALGYTMQVEQKDKYILTREELENKIATFTAGRAAEEVKFGQVSTGAANDIEQATKLARAMITRYGMSPDFDMVAMETVTNKYLGGDTSLACSAATQNQIDKQVVELVKKQHDKARKMLEENREKLDELAAHLYESETITGDEFMKILKPETAAALADTDHNQIMDIEA